jgi:hypothetical protein
VLFDTKNVDYVRLTTLLPTQFDVFLIRIFTPPLNIRLLNDYFYSQYNIIAVFSTYTTDFISVN